MYVLRSNQLSQRMEIPLFETNVKTYNCSTDIKLGITNNKNKFYRLLEFDKCLRSIKKSMVVKSDNE